MSPTPTISVMLPVRGDARFLAQAIDSLRAQSFADWEALLFGVDGAPVPSFGDARLRVLEAVAVHEATAIAGAAAEACHAGVPSDGAVGCRTRKRRPLGRRSSMASVFQGLQSF